ncbi:MAG: C40 family peptidase, partial [Bacteroidia bacterium]|nr:C40 family peptidase [Bacteroidia bacterium]
MKNKRYALAILASLLLAAEGCTALKSVIPGNTRTKNEPVTVREAQPDSSSTFYGHPKHSTIRLDDKETAAAIEEVPEIGEPEDIFLPARDTLSTLQLSLLETAKAKLGCKYKYASAGPNTFDCSGFMLYVFKQEGISLPHGSGSQYTIGKALKEGEALKPCDLVFFSGRKISSTVGHVGMVVDYNAATGEFTFIHAAMIGVEIQVSTADYYTRRYIGARRIL